MYQQSLQNSIYPGCVLGLSFILVLSVLPAIPPTNPEEKSVSPGRFGRVFESNRAAMLRVKTPERPEKFTSGFIIGGRGEFVLGVSKKQAKRVESESERRGAGDFTSPITRKEPTSILSVRSSTGAWLLADVLAQNAALGLGLGRIRGFSPGRFVPLRIDGRSPPKIETWLLTMSHDEHGNPEPFAGTLRAYSKDKAGRLRLELDIPGEAGSPVLSLSGQLAGVVYRRGRRRTKAWPMKTVLAFLKGVQLEP
jgi:hypothetical protein